MNSGSLPPILQGLVPSIGIDQIAELLVNVSPPGAFNPVIPQSPVVAPVRDPGGQAVRETAQPSVGERAAATLEKSNADRDAAEQSGRRPTPTPAVQSPAAAPTNQPVGDGSTRRENPQIYSDLGPGAEAFVSGESNVLRLYGDDEPEESLGVQQARISAAERQSARDSQLRSIDFALEQVQIEADLLSQQEALLPKGLHLRQIRDFARQATHRGELNNYGDILVALQDPNSSVRVVKNRFDDVDIHGNPIDKLDASVTLITEAEMARFEAAQVAYDHLNRITEVEGSKKLNAMEAENLQADKDAIAGLPALPTPDQAASERQTFEEAKAQELAVRGEQKRIERENKLREEKRKKVLEKLKDESLTGISDEEELEQRLADIENSIKQLNTMDPNRIASKAFGVNNTSKKEDIDELMLEREELLAFKEKLAELSPLADAEGIQAANQSLLQAGDNQLQQELQRLLGGV